MQERRVAIWDPDPVFSVGLATTLRRTSLAVDDPDDYMAWAAEAGTRALVASMSIVNSGDRLTALRASKKDLAIVAVVEDDAIEETQTALTAGACSALPRHSKSSDFAAAVLAAFDGMSLLPRETLHNLSARATIEPPLRLTTGEEDLLRALASGHTVSMLGSSFHYSPRQMHRQINRLYSKIGVANRSAAIVKATQWGLTPSLSVVPPRTRIDLA